LRGGGKGRLWEREAELLEALRGGARAKEEEPEAREAKGEEREPTGATRP
jgi:hypothetical protein